MKTKGGGLSIYFTLVTNKKDLVELHVDYLRSAMGPDFADLTIVGARPSDPDLGSFISGQSCIANKRMSTGDNCVASFKTPSGWSSGNVIVTVDYGKTKNDISVFLPTRADSHIETTSWPTDQMEKEWAKTHKLPPEINEINYLYAESQSTHSDINKYCRNAPEGWFFVEGEVKKLSKEGPTDSEYIHVVATPETGTLANYSNCYGSYRLDPTGTQLCFAAHLSPIGALGVYHCKVSVSATLAHLVWNPPYP
jgi:hypothetical protein